MIIGVIISFLLCAGSIYLAVKIIQDGGPAFVFALFFFGACIFGLSALLMIMEKAPKPVIEYPASEYKLEYKITTIGEKSDTTYVLIRYE